MRGLPTPIGSPFNLPFTPPVGVQRLPFDLFRDDMDSRRRERFQNAVAYYEQLMVGARPPATLMPQRMLFQQHKTNPNSPDFAKQAWDNSVLSYYRMVHGFRAGVPTQVARVLPTAPAINQPAAAAARRGGARTPAVPSGDPYIMNRAVRADAPNSSFYGRYQPPAGGIRDVANLAIALPVAANSRVMQAIAQTLSHVRK